MPSIKTQYVCEECGFFSTQWKGQCSECKSWNTLSEKKLLKKSVIQESSKNTPLPLPMITNVINARLHTGLDEFDRVMGGGLSRGSLTLIGGEPGVGKSTLLLAISASVAARNNAGDILYITGEELVQQVASRAARMSINSHKIHIVHESNIQLISDIVKEYRPELLILDSIQTTVSSETHGTAGSMSQVREVTYEIMGLTKTLEVTTIIVGHITKDGNIAGPKLLEHMVDTVLSFEKDQQYRILRSSKNRFGSTSEIGVFEIQDSGIKSVSTFTGSFLRNINSNLAGRCITCIFQGNRHLFIEVQALVIESSFPSGRILTQGLETKRASLLVAVIDKFLKVGLSKHDIYINIVGELRMDSRASDLAIIVATLSSLYNKPVLENSIYMGEVGLAGEVRPVLVGHSLHHELKSFGIKKIFSANNFAENLEYQDLACDNIFNITEFDSTYFNKILSA